MTDIIISFDSEDYLTPEAADAEAWWADQLTARGIRGSWQVVGEFIRSLDRRGRHDVIERIGRHEIGYHTDCHSLPPTHPEALEGLDLSAGIAHILRTEAAGLATVAETFGRWPLTYCSPGDSWTPATLLAMARMGLGVFCNDKLYRKGRHPHWYCGLLVATYDFDFQDFYEDYEPAAFERAFDELVAATPDDGVVILYTHPTRLVTAAFWDEVFAGGRRLAIADCPAAPLRPRAEIQRIQDRCSRWLDWLAGRGDLRFIDFATLYRERAASRRTIDHLRAEHDLPPGREGDLPLQHSDGDAFMPSSDFDHMHYDWLPYPEGFEGRSLIEQARSLAWTAAPATTARSQDRSCALP